MAHYTKLLFLLAFLSLVGCDQLNNVSGVAKSEAEEAQALKRQSSEKQTTEIQGVVNNQKVESNKTEPEPIQEVTAELQLAKAEITAKKPKPKKPLNYKTIEWTDLMPKEDLDALMNPPSYIAEIVDGSPEDQMSNQMANAIGAATDDKYQQALVSTKVITKMDGKAIRLPGFIVPLEFDDNQVITQFFLVPFFGACIHLPPPPPNQTIFVNYPKGMKLETLVDPLWISGVLTISMIKNDMATAAYILEMDAFEEYTEK